ncbi:hypothetical protein [Natrinema halophilum]|uniref:Uncharacterized protein n=1 Tax=Natrinema halophilum TaxID=1699371 RepID=A0A7D5KMU9_9EURY|nr:hypothetical protein [Natrinema halophilum]QLG51038.1 hypothetical protein HYG82_20490 [Natrinema halophilum]
MGEIYRELGFDALLAIASGLTLAAYMLGVILDPLPAATVGFFLVVVGVMTLVPRQARATAVALGSVAVGFAGIVIPRAVTSLVTAPVANDLVVTLIGSGLVLLLAFALLRLTAFHPQNENPA